MTKRILVLNHHGIGDVITTFPLLKMIREENATAHIGMTVKSEVEASLLDGEGWIDKFYLYYGRSMSLVEKVKFIAALRRRRYDILVNTYFIDPRQASWLAAAAGIRETVGYDQPRRKSGYLKRPIFPRRTDHRVLVNRKIGELLFGHGTRPAMESPRLTLLGEDHDFGAAFWSEHSLNDQTVVAISPGAGEGWAHKMWPWMRYAELIDGLGKRIDRVLLVGGKQEVDVAQKIANGRPHVMSLCGALTIRQTASVLSKCDLIVGGDNGLLHLAGAVGTPICAIFGPTDPGRTAPHTTVLKVVSIPMSCSPCYALNPPCGSLSPACMEEVTSVAVRCVVEETLELVVER